MCQGWKDIFGFNLAAMDHIQVCIKESANCCSPLLIENLIHFWNDLSANDGFKIRCSFSWCQIKTAGDTCSTIQTFTRKVRYWRSDAEEEKEDIKYCVCFGHGHALDYVNDMGISITVEKLTSLDCMWLMKHCRFTAKLSHTLMQKKVVTRGLIPEKEYLVNMIPFTWRMPCQSAAYLGAKLIS